MAEQPDGKKNLAITAEGLSWLDQSLGLGGFFASATPEKIHQLLPSFTLRSFAKGEQIIREGDKGGEMFVLYKGSLKVLRSRFLIGSKEVGRLAPGDFFGEVG